MNIPRLMHQTLANNILSQKLINNAAINASVNTTAFDFQTMGAQGAVSFMLDITAITLLTATDFLTFTVQESEDNVTFTDLTGEQHITPLNRAFYHPNPDTNFPTILNGQPISEYLYGHGILKLNGTVADQNPRQFPGTATVPMQLFFSYRPGVSRYVRLKITATGAPNITASLFAFANPTNYPTPRTINVS